MIELGKEYIFNYRVEDQSDNDDVELCVYNDGLNCKVVEDKGTNMYGHLYEVESCTGSQFFAYESELDSLTEKQVKFWE